MKKIFYSLFALASMAMTSTSCSDELENGTVSNSNEVQVSFNVQLENVTGSRAVGDGKTAKELHYAVYKVDKDNSDGIGIGTEIQAMRGEGTITMKEDLTAEVKFTLVKGQTYNFMFWAQSTDGEKYYYIDYPKGTIDVKYDDADDGATPNVKEKTIAANDENRDAFFYVRKDLKINGPIEEKIILKRPFAQVNEFPVFIGNFHQVLQKWTGRIQQFQKVDPFYQRNGTLNHFFLNFFYQGFYVRIVGIEGGTVNIRPVDNVCHGDLIKCLFPKQLHKRIPNKPAGTNCTAIFFLFCHNRILP